MMILFRTPGILALLALTGLATSSCLNPPEFPVEPAITFNNVKLKRLPLINGNTIEENELTFTVNFNDGDGDLGMSTDEAKLPPYSATNGSPLPGGPRNLGFSKNFYVQPYMKVNGVFVKLINPLLPLGVYDGTYPRLDGSVDGKSAPLKGSMSFTIATIPLDGFNFDVGDVLRFEISIMDRAKHESNVITTSEITLGK